MKSTCIILICVLLGTLHGRDPAGYGPGASTDTICLELWEQIESLHNQGNYSDSFHLLDSLYNYALSVEDEQFIAWSQDTKAYLYEVQGRFDLARPLYTSVLEQHRKNQRTEKVCDYLRCLSGIERASGDIDLAWAYINEAEELAKTIRDYSPYHIYKTKAYLCNILGHSDSAYHYQQLQISITTPSDSFKRSSTYFDMSDNFMKIYNYDRAKDYSIQALNSLPSNYKLGRNDILIRLANIHLAKEEYDQATAYALEAKEYLESVDHKVRLISVYTMLAKIYSKTKEYTQAQKYINLVEFADDNSNKELLSSYYLTKLHVSLQYPDLTEIRSNYQNASDIMEGYNHLFKNARWQQIKSAYQDRIGNVSQSNQALLKYYELTDSINSLERNYIVENLEVKYETEKKENEITRLELEDQLNQSQINQQRLAIGGLAGGVGLLGLLLYRIFGQNKKINAQNVIITDALADKETLIREIHHRVKNNLQVISSLLGIQSLQITDIKAKEAIQEGRSRVHSMSLIHQNLYKKDNLTGIEMRDYMKKLSTSIISSYSLQPDQVEVEQDIEDMTLDVETVVPIGLITNELLTNSLKYAFPDNRKGVITIKLREQSNQLQLKISDNGIGLDPDQLKLKEENFGHSLIRAFRNKLDATININGDNGTEVTIIMNNYKIYTS